MCVFAECKHENETAVMWAVEKLLINIPSYVLTDHEMQLAASCADIPYMNAAHLVAFV